MNYGIQAEYTPKVGVIRLAVLFVISAVALSNLGSQLMLNRLRLPLYVPEPLFVLGLLFFWRETLAVVRRALAGRGIALLLFLLLVWACLTALAIATSPYPRGLLGSGRSYLYIILIAYFCRSIRSVPTAPFLVLSMGAMIGSIAAGLITWERMSLRADQETALGNLAGTFHAVVIPLLMGSVLLTSAIAVPVAARIFTSGYRILVLVGGLAALVAVIWRLIALRRAVDVLRLCIAGLGTVALVIVAIWYLENIGTTEKRLMRIVDRIEMMIQGRTYLTGDAHRLEQLRSVVPYALENPLPKGLPTKGAGNWLPREMTGYWIDMPPKEVVWMFGGPLAFLVIAWIGYRGVKAALKVSFRPQLYSYADIALGLSIVLYAALFLLNGGFLSHLYEAVFFGIALGRWIQLSSNTIPMSDGTYDLEATRLSDETNLLPSY